MHAAYLNCASSGGGIASDFPRSRLGGIRGSSCRSPLASQSPCCPGLTGAPSSWAGWRFAPHYPEQDLNFARFFTLLPILSKTGDSSSETL